MPARKSSAKFVLRLMTDQAGATAIEYGLIASLIAVGAVQALEVVGNEMSNTFTNVNRAMSGLEQTSPTGANSQRGEP